MRFILKIGVYFFRAKSRTEEINALIAQSQQRARLLLASAPLSDDSLKIDTTSVLSRNINANANATSVPNEQYWAMTSTPRSTVEAAATATAGDGDDSNASDVTGETDQTDS